MTLPAVSIFSKVLFIKETSFNTPPATPTMVDVPFTDCSLSFDVTNVVDHTIQGDTMHRSVLPTTQKVAGGIGGYVSHTNMDWLFEGISYSTFAANVVKVGIVQSSYSIEVGSSDISQYILYSGLVIDKLSLTMAPAAPVTFKADFIGATANANAATHANVTTAAPQTVPMTVVNAIIKEGGSNVAYITGATFSFDRKHTLNYAMGSAVPVSISTSFFDLTGTVDVFFQDQVMYNKFKNATASSLDFTLTDGTNTYEISVPQVRYTTAAIDVKGTGPIMMKMNFTAVYDPSSNSVTTITRSGP